MISSEAKGGIADRLSQLDDLYFPRALQSSAATPSQRKSLLLDLLSRDVAVFLERYGSKLSIEELKEFDMLKDDYEINWHLNRLRSVINPTEEEKKSKSAKIRNRRLAYMGNLMAGGQYFSEDAMREREPYLHHEYLGKFQDLSGRSMARPGERWSETLMRRSEEAILLEKIRIEQQRLGVAESDWVGNERERQEEEEEEDEEEEEEGEAAAKEEMEKEREDLTVGLDTKSSRSLELHSNYGACNNMQSTTAETVEEDSSSPDAMIERMEQFTYIMQRKFLLGEDHQHLDYSKIDHDETLDDHWMKEVNHDAEEKYFDDV